MMSERTPPGFMNAILASPNPAGAVDASWASAITSPSVVSPVPFVSVRVRSAVILPITWLASGAAAATYWLTSVRIVGSCLLGSGWRMLFLPVIGSRVGLSALSTIEFVALAAMSRPLRSFTVSVMSVMIRPNDEALVIRRDVPPSVSVHRYSWWVWPETTTPIEGSRPAAIVSIGEPARLPWQPSGAVTGVANVWLPPWWMTSTIVFTPRFFNAFAARLAPSISDRKSSPATPDGVTIVGVACRTSPMMPTFTSSPVLVSSSFTP